MPLRPQFSLYSNSADYRRGIRHNLPCFLFPSPSESPSQLSDILEKLVSQTSSTRGRKPVSGYLSRFPPPGPTCLASGQLEVGPLPPGRTYDVSTTSSTRDIRRLCTFEVNQKLHKIRGGAYESYLSSFPIPHNVVLSGLSAIPTWLL